MSTLTNILVNFSLVDSFVSYHLPLSTPPWKNIKILKFPGVYKRSSYVFSGYRERIDVWNGIKGKQDYKAH